MKWSLWDRQEPGAVVPRSQTEDGNEKRNMCRDNYGSGLVRLGCVAVA